MDELGETLSQHPYQSIVALHPYQYIGYRFSVLFANGDNGFLLRAILEQPGFWGAMAKYIFLGAGFIYFIII